MKRVNKIWIWAFSALFGLSAFEAFPATSSENYTVRHLLRQQVSGTPASLTSAQAMQTVTYYDGLGRPNQSIEVGASPTGKDIIIPVEYDSFGRGDAKTHLPYMSTTSGGGYHSSALTEKTLFYSGKFGSADAARAFTENIYENSPLNRVVQQKKPGSVYTSRPATSAYGSNAANEVLKITVNTSHDFVVSGYYPAATLFKNSVTDEDGLIVTAFTDKLGRTLLERSTGGETILDTYYVYDDFNQLCWVISPEGAHSLVNGTYAPTHATALNYCYMYKYDSRGRVFEKRLPGAESVEMVYDQADRLIASRDGKGKVEGYWIVNQYDAFDRLTEQRRSSNATFDTGDALLIQNIYDNPSAAALDFSSVANVVTTYDNRVKGVKTYEKVAVVGGTEFVERTFYYDSKGRLVQTVETNHLGGVSRYSTQYDFIGNAVSTHESHTVNGTTHTVLTTNGYDHRNRLTATTTKLNGGSPVTVSYAYDDLGMLRTKTPGSLAPATYSYDIRGWQTGQSSARFTTELDYFGAGKYAGNITRWSWGHGNAVDQHYALEYNALGWLTSGVHSSGRYKECIFDYDRNGNAKDYLRTFGGNDWHSIFTYNGNRLIGQNENGAGVKINSFDTNGNMTDHGFLNFKFEYNFLNLSHRVRALGSGELLAHYVYDAHGRKLQVRDGSGTNGYDYLGRLRLTWNNGTPMVSEVNFGAGVVRSNGEIRFFEKDHLGSVRAVLTDRGDVLERSDYMPFGLRHGGGVLDVNNDYRFNGKEVQTLIAAGEHLDYGARLYRADQAPSWYTPDPLAEKRYGISPYAYVSNNPVNRIDPDGRDDWHLHKMTGMTEWMDKSEEHMLHALDKDGNRTGISLTIKDRSVFDQLAGGGGKKGSPSFAHGKPSDLASVFLFAADNSNAEWRFSRYNAGNGDQYAIGTAHDSHLAIDAAQMGFDPKDEIAVIHSHPTEYKTTQGEYGSMGWEGFARIWERSDSDNVYRNKHGYRSNANYLTYFPHTGNIYQVRGIYQPALIRNIRNHGNNPNRLFWGTLNGQ